MNMKKTTLLILSLILVLFFDYEFAFAADQESESNVKTLLWPDGTRYVGGIVNGKRSGEEQYFGKRGLDL